MSEFRSEQEIQQVYQERHEAGKTGPYLLEYKTGHQKLTFFGSQHSNDPEDPQWDKLDSAWQSFVANPNPSKLVLTEGRSDGGDESSKEDALKKFGESGLVSWMAREQGIKTECPEPDRIEEITALRKQFSVPEIITYYFGRQMHQWVRQDFETHPDWQEYIEDALNKYGSLPVWGDEKFDLAKTKDWFSEFSGKDFDPNDQVTLYNLSDPAQSKVSAASGILRDKKLIQAITDSWQDGQDIFVIYGSGHAIRLEFAIKDLISG